jgi:hypothetical protein
VDSGSRPVIFCHSLANTLNGIVNVRYGRLYRLRRYETQIPFPPRQTLVGFNAEVGFARFGQNSAIIYKENADRDDTVGLSPPGISVC